MDTSGRKIDLIEVSPRDGLQNEGTVVTSAGKLELVERSARMGATRIEVTSFVSPKRVPQLADADSVAGSAVSMSTHWGSDVELSGLVLNDVGLQRATRSGLRAVNFVLVATDSLGRRNQGQTVRDGLAAWADIHAEARRLGLSVTLTVAAAFGCPFEGAVPESRVLAIVEEAMARRPDEIALADTIGIGVPTQVRVLMRGLQSIDDSLRTRFHFHNTRNTGYMNAIAAVEEGADALDSSLGGVGGCPFSPGASGNIATEDLAYMLARMGFVTGVDHVEAARAGDWLCGVLGRESDAKIGKAAPVPVIGESHDES